MTARKKARRTAKTVPVKRAPLPPPDRLVDVFDAAGELVEAGVPRGCDLHVHAATTAGWSFRDHEPKADA